MAIFSPLSHATIQGISLRLLQVPSNLMRALGSQLRIYGDRLRAAEGLGLIWALAIGASTGLTVVFFTIATI